MAMWDFVGLDSVLTADATVFEFRFVRNGEVEEPAICASIASSQPPAQGELDPAETDAKREIDALCDQILERVQDDLEKIARLKRIESACIEKRLARNDAAASAAAAQREAETAPAAT